MRVLTTVGVSIYRNFSKSTIDYEMDMKKFAKQGMDTKYDKEETEDIIESIVDWGESNDSENICAEIKCLEGISKKYNEDLQIQLISSDTVEGYICAEAIKRILKNKGRDVCYEKKNDIIDKLQVQNEQEFQRNGLNNLVEYMNKYGQNYDMERIDVAYNFSGGFKSVIPYVTIIAQLYKVPMFYIFEDTDELIEIRPTPMILDYRLFSKYSEIMEKLNEMISVSEWEQILQKNEKFKYEIRQAKAYYTIDKDMVYLNAIGRMMYNDYKNHYFVKLYRDNSYFNESIENKRIFDRGIQELCRRFSEIIQGGMRFESLQDEDLKHVPLKGYYIAKIKIDRTQLRILYKFEEQNEEQIIKVYDVIIKKDNASSEYSKIYDKFINTIKDDEEHFFTIRISKN